MEPSSLTLIAQFSRRSLQAGVHSAYLVSSRRDTANFASRESTSNLDELQMIDPFESSGHRFADGTTVTDNLCRNCEAIDITSHLRRQGPCDTKLALSLGTLLEVVTKADCAFCTFVQNVIRAQYASLIDESFWRHCSIYGNPVNCVLEELWIPSNKAPVSKSDILRFGFYIKLDPHPFLSGSHHDHTNLANATFHTLADLVETNGNIYQARKIANQLEPNLLRRWLTICETRHPYHPRHIPGLRLIDLLENCLVLPDATVRYVALSYVWGSAPTLTLRSTNSEELHTLGGLRRHAGLPKTIRDAMRLSKMLRERFLWVDALCITQDDESDKQAQIMKMDQVYQNAVLTLVACTGTSADSGLPGLHPYTRLPVQVAGSIRGQALISHDVEKWWVEARHSVWETRGWTYQEELCSNRLLVIGKSQVHFRCKGNCVFCEDIAAEGNLDTSPLDSPSPQTTNYFPRAIWTTQTDNFQAYQNVVTEYSKRAISNTRDALNAVSGVLNRWRHHYGHWGLINGLPAGMMDAALLWQGKGVHRRRRDPRTGHTIGYPSWSWAAWEGQFEFPNASNPHDTLLSMIRWEPHERYEDNLAPWRKFLGPEDPNMADGPAQNWTRTVTITPFMETIGIHYIDNALPAGQALFAYPSRRNAEAVTVYGTTELNGVLRFRAKCGFFPVASRNLASSSPMTLILHDSSSLIVLDKDGCAAGAVQVPSAWLDNPTWVDAISRTPQEFVVLSRTTLTQDVADPSWDETTQSFLLEEPTDRNQVLYEGKTAQRLRDHLNSYGGPESYLGSWSLFDRQKYSAFKFWPLYNVLLVHRNGEHAFRSGLGQIHIDAFDPIAEEKLVLLS